MSQKPIYLDYMATTPCDEQVVDAMLPYLSANQCFGNASSASHLYGQEAKQAVEQARRQLAALIGTNPSSIIWTSGATESNNLALLGAADFYQRRGKHIITMSTEHVAVLDTCGHLSSAGYQVTYIDPLPNGQLDLIKLQNKIQDDTVLVSIMHINNETGIIQDINRIGGMLKEKGILFHVDAAQSLGKIPIALQSMPVDLMSFSAHKIYGPKGIGALYVREKPKLRLTPMSYGGGQEKGLRSGTLATHQIVGMGQACEIAMDRMDKDQRQMAQLSALFIEKISSLADISINGDSRNRYPGCLNIHFSGVDGDTLLQSLPSLALSKGSACNAIGSRPSHVLLAYGLSPLEANQSLRISFGRYTTKEQVEIAANQIIQLVNKLRQISPVWEG